MDFVFMLTRSDRTVPDALDVLDDIRALGIKHLGFKDVGVEPGVLAEVHKRMKQSGATTYLEVVSTSPEAALQSAKIAAELRVDKLLGGTQVEEILRIIAGSGVQYLPFPGKPHGHPTKLGGTAEDVARDCERFTKLGCAGVDLLAYRATEADPLDLVRAARKHVKGELLVAGAVTNAAQIKALKDAGADSFTVGTAVFDGSFAPNVGSIRSQLKAVLDACA